jgi:dihydroorotase (multifunctional complex type)
MFYVGGSLIKGSLGVRDGRIVNIASDDSSIGNADVDIDLGGKLALPGLIDMHVHCRDLEHGYKETFTTATRAAAAGGVTTICDMPNTIPPTTTAQRYREKIALASDQVYVDYSIWGGGVDLAEIPGIAAEGAIGYKIYLHTSSMKGTPHHRGVFVEDDGQLLDIFVEVEKTGLPLMIHLDNQAISDRLRQRLVAEGANTALDYLAPWETIGMEEAALKTFLFSSRIGTKIHIAHVPNPQTVELAREAKRKNIPVTVEIISPYLFLSYEHVKRRGPYALPVAKPQEQIDAYWEQLLRGDIDTIGTDHAPHTRAEKDVGFKNIWQTAPGVTGLETYLGQLLTEVNKGRLSIPKLVELTAENPAKILGFPHKGSLIPGHDADITVIDLNRVWEVNEDLLETKPKWSPFAGEQLRGRAVMTIVRGRIIMNDGKIVGEAGWGQFQRPRRGAKTTR